MDNKILKMCSQFVKKNGPQILAGVALGTVAIGIDFKAYHGFKTKDRTVCDRSQPVVIEPKKPKLKISEEQRKYANWMRYEKESTIIDAYNEFKEMEDFG